jgi:hypothetical protein
VPLGLLHRAAPGGHARGRQVHQRLIEPPGMDGGGGQALLGGEQHVVPRTRQVLGHRQVEVRAQAEGEGGALTRQGQTGAEVTDGRFQLSGQQPEHPPVRQAIDVDCTHPGRVGLHVNHLG